MKLLLDAGIPVRASAHRFFPRISPCPKAASSSISTASSPIPESLHLAAYNQVLADHAHQIAGLLEISREQYFSRYIVFGDREAFFHMLHDHARPANPELLAQLTLAKHALFHQRLSDFAEPLPGVRNSSPGLQHAMSPRHLLGREPR